jgi:hypothetical protein
MITELESVAIATGVVGGIGVMGLLGVFGAVVVGRFGVEVFGLCVS